MPEQLRDGRTEGLELVHHYVGGDGADALEAFVERFTDSHREISFSATQYENMRLRVKERILNENPPSIWTGWPSEASTYTDVGAVADISDSWEREDWSRDLRSSAVDAARIDGTFHTLPLAVHRFNDLYVHTAAVEQTGIDPGSADDPVELVELLRQAADERDGAGILLPMTEPFTVLQLWEVVLLGMTDHETFRAITDGNAASNRDAIERALDCLTDFADLAPDDALYQSMTDANERFVEGVAPVYPQGDWAGGVFVETPDFAFGEDWTQIPFPGTDGQFGVVMDALIPHVDAPETPRREFLRFAGSREAQEVFNRKKGSLPVRSDVSMDGFSELAQSQNRQLERASAQPQSITHGLSVTSLQLVDLKSIIAEFIDTWDTATTAGRMVDVFDE